MSPSAIFTQNARTTSRRIGGRPGDLIAGLPVCLTNHPDCLPITHLHIKVLRRPLESAHGPSWKVLLELIVSQGLWIRDAADQVAYPHTLFGTDDTSWTMFMGIYDGSQTVAEVAEMVVKIEPPPS